MHRILLKSLKRAWQLSGRVLPVGWREWLLLQALQPGRRAGAGRSRSDSRGIDFPGINLVGYLSQPTGLGESARGLAAAMERSFIKVEAIDCAMAGMRLLTRGGMKMRGEYPVTLWCMNGFEMFLAMRKLGWGKSLGKMNVCYWYWELEKFPLHWRPAIGLVDEIWTASAFNAACFQNAAPPGTGVFIVPPTVAISPPSGDWRMHFSLPKECLTALVMADFGSIAERKNPAASIRAVRRMRDASGKPVFLVVKTRNMERFPEDRAKLLDAVGGMECKIFDADMSRGEIAGLYQACDVVVNLHRSEGFGLIPAEAMALGKPVIATNWSGVVDFMNMDNSWPVPYRLVRNERACSPYPKGSMWAEADIDAAGRALAEIASNPELAARKGRLAKETIGRLYSRAATREAIENRYAAWSGAGSRSGHSNR